MAYAELYLFHRELYPVNNVFQDLETVNKWFKKIQMKNNFKPQNK